MRTSKAPPRAQGSVALVLASVGTILGCGDDWMTAPVTDLRIEQVEPEIFGAGDTVEVRGPGIGRADLRLAGEALEVLSRSRGRQVVVAHDALPRCDSPLPSVPLVARFDDLESSLDLSSLGLPLDVSLGVADHVVMTDLEEGCRVRFDRGGTYGVALFRTAVAGLTRSGRARQSITVNLRGGRSPLQKLQGEAGTIEGATALSSHRMSMQAFEGRASNTMGTCSSSPLAVGDQLELNTPYIDERLTYEVASASPHYAVLAELDSLTAYSGARREMVENLATDVEAEAHPFLDQAFRSWPDIDGNGQLFIVFEAGFGAAYAGAHGHRVDGCPGDFIHLTHGLLDREGGREDLLRTIVHEAAHWYDIGPSLERQSTLPVWTIEAVPTLVTRLWELERDGQTMWGNRGTDWCPAGAICTRKFLQDDRFGGGLSLEGGYSYGSYILQYLLEQVLEPGTAPHDAIGRLRDRSSSHEDFRLRPIYEVLGGTGRSEAELIGEYLLAYYADEHVAGASPRVTLFGWNVPENTPEYPLRAFTLSSEVPRETLRVGRPDGTVFEVHASPGAVLSTGPSPTGLALGIVRAN